MDKKRLDLVFCQVNKHKPNMTFESFLQTLTKIAEYKYPREGGQGLALQKVLENHLMPLYDLVMKQTQADQKQGGNIEIEYDELVNILMMSVGKVLFDVY